MKLSAFILDNMETILLEWENFASTLFPTAQNENTIKLRDHAKKILLVIVAQLNQYQSNSEQVAKSKGLQLQNDKQDTAAKKHGSGRLEDGFNINEMVSEYRALRASVTKLFRDASKEKIQPSDITDLIRFNEGIDQAIAESVASYSNHAEQNNLLFETMLSSSPDLSYILDLDGKFLYVNRALIELYQIDVHEILGTATYNYAIPAAAIVQAHIQYIIQTGEMCRGEITFQMPSDNPRFFEYIYAPVFNKKGKIEAIACASRDISERRAAEALIWQSANYDPLTELVNRRLFRERLEQTLKRSKRSHKIFALLFIDLDKFKTVNDALGHHAGDRLLKETVKRVNTCIRETDTLARMGGDEFTVILDDIRNVEQVISVAEAILSALRKPFSFRKHKVNISVSIGITLCPQDGTSPDILVRNADQAMYVAKKDGGNQLSFYTSVS